MDQSEALARLVAHCMETAVAMKIRLPVALKRGPTWGDLEPLPLAALERTN